MRVGRRSGRAAVTGLVVAAVAVLAPPPVTAERGHEWSKRLGGAHNDAAYSVAVDASGAVLVAGSTCSPSIDLGGGPLTGGPSVEECDMVIAKYSGSGAHVWSKRLGSGDETAHSVAVDPSGAVLIAGRSGRASIDLGGGSLIGLGSSDIVVAKYSPSGAHVWSKRLGGSGDDIASSVAVDPSGAVLLVGRSDSPSIDLGGGSLAEAGAQDMVVAKFSSSGAHVWSKRLGGSDWDEALSVTADVSGAVLFVGETSSASIDLGGGPLVGLGFYDMTVAKYSASGSHLWSKRLGGEDSDVAMSVAADASGAVLVAGFTRSTSIDLGGGPLIGRPGADIALAKYTPEGAHMWSKRLGGPDDDIANAVAVNGSGAVLLAGTSDGTSIDLGGGPLPGQGTDDIVVAKYSASGAHLWSERFGDVSGDYAFAVAADPWGAVLLAAYTISPLIDMGGGPLTGSSDDLVVAKYSRDEAAPVTSMVPMQVGVLDAGASGVVTDDLSGVEGVTVTYTLVGLSTQVVVEAALSCDGPRQECSFTAPSPGPGVWDAAARARDRASNVEDPGPRATIVTTP